MGKTLRILNVEDSVRDVELLMRHLHAAGYELTSECVETAETMKAALDAAEWDVVLCDYKMPRFNALAAFDILRKSGLDIPFIIISGTVGEEVAVQAMLTGANDYLPKDNLTRLVPAIERELNEAENRRRQRNAEVALKASEAELRAVFAAMNDVILVLDSEGRHLKVAPTNPAHLYKRGTARIGKTVHEIFPTEMADLMLENIQRALKERRTQNVEYSLVFDGEELWFDASVAPMSEDSVVWIARDITERKHAEAEAIRSQERLRDLIDGLGPSMFVGLMTTDGTLIECNRPSLSAAGLKPDDVLGKPFDETYWWTYSPEVQQQLREAIARAAQGEASRYDVQIRISEDNLIDADFSLQPLRDESGEIVFLVPSASVITERKRAESALQEKTALLEAQLNSSIDGILVVDEHGSKILQNQQLVDLLKIPSHIADDPNDEKQFKWVTGMMKYPKSFVERVVHLYSHPGEISRDEVELKNGTILDRYSAPVKGEDGNHYGRIWTFRDITESKRDENERRIIFEIIQGSITTPNLNEFLTLVHRSISQIVYAENCFVLLHDPVSDIEHFEFWVDKYDPPPAPRSAGRGFSSYVLRTGKPLLMTKELLKEIVDADEAELVGSFSPSWIGVPLQTPARTIGTLVIQHYEMENAYNQRDLEFLSSVGDQIALAIERKRAEEALGESEERYRDLVENATDIIFTHDLTGNYTSVNKAVEIITGYTREEALSMNLSDTVAPEYLEKARQSIAAKLAGRQVTAYELEIIAKDGRRVVVEVNTRIIFENDVPVGVQGIARDITERKRAKDVLTQAEEKYRNIFENALEGIFQITIDGCFLTANPALALMLGYESPAEFIAAITDTGQLFVEAKRYGEFRRLLAKPGVAQGFETQVYRKNRSEIWISLNARAFRDDHGAVLYAEGTAKDITQDVDARQAVKPSTFLLRILGIFAGIEIIMMFVLQFLNIPDGIWFYLLDALLLAILGAPFVYFWVVKGLARHLVREATVAQIEARAQERRYRKLVENLDAIVWEADIATSQFSVVSQRAEEILGYPVKQWLTEPDFWINHIHPEDRERGVAFHEKAIAEEKGLELEYRMKTADGRWVWFQDSCRVLWDEFSGKRKISGIMIDITERKKADQKFRDLLESAPDAMILVDRGGKITLINSQTEKLFGWQREELLGKKIESLVPDLVRPDHSRHRSDFFAVPNARPMGAGLELHGLRKDGGEIPIEISLSPIDTEEGTMVMSAIRDISVRKDADEAMRESEERFSGAFEYAPIGVALVSPDGYWLKVNRALCDLVGYSEAELLTSTFQEITHPDDLERDLEHMHRLIDGEISSYQIEKRYIHKLGQVVSTLLNVSLVRDANGQPRYFISQIQDITQRKELEEQFRQSQKMEAVGVLAGGIAHDFNNLLTAINGYSDLTLRRMPADDPLRHNIEEVKKAGNRAAELTSQLLAFSRKQVLKPMVHSLNQVISNIENMLRRIMRENVELRTVLDPELGNIKADPGQIEQVIMNLAVNARDAMHSGGTLTIETQNVYLDEDYVSQHLSVAPGPFVKLTITDTGDGMDKNIQKHIFEPFFTTKEVGKGTGLGLSMVYGVVKQSGGDILVYSEPEHGTTFKIYLPSVDERVEKPKWVGDTVERYVGTETILLVEDEQVVRDLVSEILTENGYTVLEAESGKVALSLCLSHSGPIHLLLTDVIMPNMGGSELKKQVVELYPDIKVLFMSGYTDDSIAHHGVFDSDIEFIEKPFTPDGLSRKIREVLEYREILNDATPAA